MDLSFYHLNRDPFPPTPNLRSLFVSSSHQMVLRSLSNGLAARQGMIVITGEQGLGKTTIVRSYLEHTDPQRIKALYINDVHVTFARLLQGIYTLLGVSSTATFLSAMISDLHTVLTEEQRENRNVVLIMDNAHNLSDVTLAHLWLLTRLETTATKLIQIVLLGRPALTKRLKQPAMKQLKQSIAVSVTMAPLTKKESLAYIGHQLTQAAVTTEAIFTTGALTHMVKHAKGILGDLNLLCSDVLNAGLSRHEQPITAKTVQSVLGDMKTSRSPGLWHWAFAGSVGLLLLGGCWWYVLSPLRPGSVFSQKQLLALSTELTAAPVSTPKSMPHAAAAPGDLLEETISTQIRDPRTLSGAGAGRLGEAAAPEHNTASDAQPSRTLQAGNTTRPPQTSAGQTIAPPSLAPTQRLPQLLHEAQTLLRANKLTAPPGASAYDRYQDVLRLEPGNIAAKEGIAAIIARYKQWGQKALRQANYAAAVTYYQRAIRLDGRDPGSYHGLGVAYHETGQQAQAVQAYRQGLRLAPGHAALQHALADLRAEQVQAALRARGLHGVQVRIEAEHQVTLTGQVTDEHEEQLALAIAHSQPEVERVVSRVTNRTQATIQGIWQGAFVSHKR